MDKYLLPNVSSSALITIDVQHDVLDGQPLEIPGTTAVLPNIKTLLDLFRKNRKHIVHMIRIYKKDGSNVDLSRKTAIENGETFLMEGTEGGNIAKGLLPSSNIKLDFEKLLLGRIQVITDREVIIYKPRWGAFYKTPLEEYLQERKINTLIFTGCNFPNCPRTSIYEASERDYKIILAEDAVSGLYERGVKEMRNIGISVMETDTIIKSIKS
jgi:nicotinamidase-related amidase